MQISHLWKQLPPASSARKVCFAWFARHTVRIPCGQKPEPCATLAEPTFDGEVASGASDDIGKLVRVAIAGRPVAYYLNDGMPLELLRANTDVTLNACSFRCAPSANMTRLMGDARIIDQVHPDLRERGLGASVRVR
jgi:hypothetical protein